MVVTQIENENGKIITVAAEVLESGDIQIEVIGPNSTASNLLTHKEAEAVKLVLGIALDPLCQRAELCKPITTEESETMTEASELLRLSSILKDLWASSLRLTGIETNALYRSAEILEGYAAQPAAAPQPAHDRIVAHEDCLNCCCPDDVLCAGTEPRKRQKPAPLGREAITQIRNDLRRLAIVQHERQASGGRFVNNGKSCKVCGGEWPDRAPEFHAITCSAVPLDAILAGMIAPLAVKGQDWVNCPICGEPDMRKEIFDEGLALIHCTNHGCPSNGAPAPPAVDRAAVIEKRRGIYIASKTKYAPRWREYRAHGEPIISTWIDEAGEGESADLHDLWDRCLSEAASCQVLIVYRESSDVLKGAWVEIGAALQARNPVYAVGLEGFTIAKYRGITHFDTIESAFKAASTLAGTKEGGK
jgi:hypothetical protein